MLLSCLTSGVCRIDPSEEVERFCLLLENKEGITKLWKESSCWCVEGLGDLYQFGLRSYFPIYVGLWPSIACPCLVFICLYCMKFNMHTCTLYM